MSVERRPCVKERVSQTSVDRILCLKARSWFATALVGACNLAGQVLSVVGMLGLNALFLEVNWNIITSDEEYVPFPATWLCLSR